MKNKPDSHKPSAAFRVGVVSLVFMIIGFQVALFVHRAAVMDIISHRDNPDTVFIYLEKGNDTKVTLKSGEHTPEAREAYTRFAPRQYRSFRFDPNTVSHDSLVMLGFTDKQAASIIRYRDSGGRFRRKSDFAHSYVVEDSVFRRLEPFIDIPLLDINSADSSQFDSLPGIGPYFASKMVSYRNELGGYSFPEQLMDIYHFDNEKFEALKDLICCNPADVRPFGLWTLPADSLRLHPYIRNWNTAKAIVLFRENTTIEEHTAASLAKAGIISSETAAKLARIAIDPGP